MQSMTAPLTAEQHSAGSGYVVEKSHYDPETKTLFGISRSRVRLDEQKLESTFGRRKRRKRVVASIRIRAYEFRAGTEAAEAKLIMLASKHGNDACDRAFQETFTCLKKEAALHARDRIILVMGSTGDGKSRLLNYLRGLQEGQVDEDGKEACDVGNVGTGITKLVTEYKGTGVSSYKMFYIDTPGVGDQDFTLRKLVGALESYFRVYGKRISGIIVTNNLASNRLTEGSKVVTGWIESGLVKEVDGYQNVIFVGTHGDKVNQLQRKKFHEDVAMMYKGASCCVAGLVSRGSRTWLPHDADALVASTDGEYTFRGPEDEEIHLPDMIAALPLVMHPPAGRRAGGKCHLDPQFKDGRDPQSRKDFERRQRAIQWVRAATYSQKDDNEKERWLVRNSPSNEIIGQRIVCPHFGYLSDNWSGAQEKIFYALWVSTKDEPKRVVLQAWKETSVDFRGRSMSLTPALLNGALAKLAAPYQRAWQEEFVHGELGPQPRVKKVVGRNNGKEVPGIKLTIRQDQVLELTFDTKTEQCKWYDDLRNIGGIPFDSDRDGGQHLRPEDAEESAERVQPPRPCCCVLQ